MNKKLSLFLILSFLAVQVFSTLHMVDYGLEKHEHNGQICDIYLHFEQSKSSTPAAQVSLALASYTSFVVILPEVSVIQLQRYPAASPRAPPILS
ncbi:MAG: hypothetical protein P8P30_07745 [Rickettsiales bacterium]|nr:hypothetical protein [Rickettsiales bacterium]